MAYRDGDRRARDAAAGVRRRRDAETVRARTRGDGKVNPMANVTLRNVRKTYPGGFEAIKGVNVDVGDGQFCVLVGPSGCGKSTLLRMVAGLETVTGGEIDIGGRIVNQIEPADRDIAMVFQNYALYPHMSVFNNMAYGLRNRGMKEAEVKTRVDEAARVLELTSMLERKPRQLSGGQRKARATSRAASASASPWAAPSCASRKCFCSTSRCPTSTQNSASRCGSRSANCSAGSTPRRSTSPTTSSRR